MLQKDFTNEFKFRTSRSSGKGGQHVNKVSSKVELLFHVDASQLLSVAEKALLKKKLNNRISVNGCLHIVNQESRSQLRNKETAIQEFYKMIQGALKKQKKRITTKIPAGVNAKRLENKKMNSLKKASRKKVNPSPVL